VKERCIIGKLRITLVSGEDYSERSPNDRLFKSVEMDSIIKQDDLKQEDFKTDEILASQTNTMNETKVLKDRLNMCKIEENKMITEIEILKKKLQLKEEENKKIPTEQTIKCNIEELEKKLQEKEKQLKKSFQDNAALRSELNDKTSTIEAEINRYLSEIDSYIATIDHLNNLVSEKDTSLEEKEKEISHLIERLNMEKHEVKEKDGAYNELQSLITAEDETLVQVEHEMKRLLEVIAEDQETILNKDKSILSLQNLLQDKEEFINRELSGISKDEMECLFKKTIDEQTAENSKVIEDIKLHVEETDKELDKLNSELEEKRKILADRENENIELKDKIKSHNEFVQTHEALKIKCEDLMSIIMKQHIEMEAIKNNCADHDALVSRNEMLQKEIHVLKVAIQQKEMDVKSLNDLLASKDNIDVEGKDENVGSLNELKQMFKEEQDKSAQSEKENLKLKNEMMELKIVMANINSDLMSKNEIINELQIELMKNNEFVENLKCSHRNELITKEKEIFCLTMNIRRNKEEMTEKERKAEMIDTVANIGSVEDKNTDEYDDETVKAAQDKKENDVITIENCTDEDKSNVQEDVS